MYLILIIFVYPCTVCLLNGNGVEAGALTTAPPISLMYSNGTKIQINKPQNGKSAASAGQAKILIPTQTTNSKSRAVRPVGHAAGRSWDARGKFDSNTATKVFGKPAPVPPVQTVIDLTIKTPPSVGKEMGGARAKPNRSAIVRIIGGSTAVPNEFPYHVAVAQDDKTGCGGSILTPEYVLTAAHCTAGYEAQYLTVTAGDHILSKEEGHEQERDIAEVIDHDEYDPSSMRHDISILKLEKPFKFNRYVQAVELAEPTYVPKGTVTITGWGKTDSEDSVGTDRLQKIDLPIANHKICADNYEEVEPNKPITDKQICAGYFDRDGKDACQGDSGGPAVVKIANKFIQVGVTSFGIGCALSGFPGIYSSIPKYRDWIDKIIKSGPPEPVVKVRTYNRGRQPK